VCKVAGNSKLEHRGEQPAPKAPVSPQTALPKTCSCATVKPMPPSVLTCQARADLAQGRRGCPPRVGGDLRAPQQQPRRPGSPNRRHVENVEDVDEITKSPHRRWSRVRGLGDEGDPRLAPVPTRSSQQISPNGDNSRFFPTPVTPQGRAPPSHPPATTGSCLGSPAAADASPFGEKSAHFSPDSPHLSHAAEFRLSALGALPSAPAFHAPSPPCCRVSFCGACLTSPPLPL
jgi:hypothetical protein